MGLHPTSVKPETYLHELELVEEAFRERDFVAVGEIGIDLYWDTSTLEIQKEAFRRQIQLAKKKGLRPKKCLDYKGYRAGYYCMVTREPVSEKNSRGGISWFPSGADLARIRKDKFDELAPWVGLY